MDVGPARKRVAVTPAETLYAAINKEYLIKTPPHLHDTIGVIKTQIAARFPHIPEERIGVKKKEPGEKPDEQGVISYCLCNWKCPIPFSLFLELSQPSGIERSEIKDVSLQFRHDCKPPPHGGLCCWENTDFQILFSKQQQNVTPLSLLFDQPKRETAVDVMFRELKACKQRGVYVLSPEARDILCKFDQEDQSVFPVIGHMLTKLYKHNPLKYTVKNDASTYVVIIEDWRYEFSAWDVQGLMICNKVIDFNAVDMDNSCVFHRNGRPTILLAIRKKFYRNYAMQLGFDREEVLSPQPIADKDVLDRVRATNPGASELLDSTRALEKMSAHFSV